MNLRRWATYFIVLFVTVLFSSVAYGETAPPSQKGGMKPVEKKPGGKVTLPMERQMLQGCPWENERGYANNRNRSDFSGPGTGPITFKTVNLTDELNLPGGGSATNPPVFQSIRTGRAGWAYVSCISEGKPLVYAFNINTGLHFLMGHEMYNGGGSWSSHSLGPFGYVFTIGKNGVVYCLKHDGSIQWEIPAKDVPNAKLISVGKYVYFRCKNSNGDFIKAYNKDGSFAWLSGYNELTFAWLAAEDSSSNLYIPTPAWNVMKIGSDANSGWTTSIPTGAGAYNFGLPLIYGNDDRVYINFRPATPPGQSPYCVLNPDGSIYKSGTFAHGSYIVDASYGGDGRFYVLGSDDTITCYQDWDSEVWSKAVPGNHPEGHGPTLLNAVMDKDNILYVIQRNWDDATPFYLHVIKPDGQMLPPVNFTLPEGAGQIFHVAIGDGNTLLVLNSMGYLTIFPSGPEKLKIEKMPINKKVLGPPEIR